MKYRTRNVTIEATQWMKMGDHPDVIAGWMRSDGQCFDHKPLGGPSIEYPVIKTLEGWHGVSPLDYIITGLKGEHYPCKPDVFDMKYECAEGDNWNGPRE